MGGCLLPGCSSPPITPAPGTPPAAPAPAKVSPSCHSLSEPIDIATRAELVQAVGLDTVKAAVERVAELRSRNPHATAPALTEAGRTAANSTARAKGRTLTSKDLAELEAYLGQEVIPTVVQNPACRVAVVSVEMPFPGIDHVTLAMVEGRRIPTVWVKNAGPLEAECHLLVRVILNGKEDEGIVNLRVGPGQTRSVPMEQVKWPAEQFDATQHDLLMHVTLSYRVPHKRTLLTAQEIWRYDHRSSDFFRIHPR